MTLLCHYRTISMLTGREDIHITWSTKKDLFHLHKPHNFWSPTNLKLLVTLDFQQVSAWWMNECPWGYCEWVLLLSANLSLICKSTIHLHTHRPVQNKNLTYRHYMDTWLHTYRQYLLLFLKTESTFLNRLIVKFTKLLAF